jgi:hypothetical protein
MNRPLLRAQLEPKGWNSLPAEVRLMIYSYTWQPRKVFVDRQQQEQGEAPVLKLRVRSPPPVTLHLNFEAREATLRHYVPFFRDEASGAVAYFNPDVDVMFLSFLCGNEFVGPEYHTQLGRFCSVVAFARHIFFTGDGLECEVLKAMAVLPDAEKPFPALRIVDQFSLERETEEEDV